MFALSIDDLEIDRDRRCDPVDRLLASVRRYEHPQDVLADVGLTPAEKRAVLSSWASDAHAVESAPPLRRPPFAARAASIDDVMAALRRLDTLALSPAGRRAGRGALEAIAALQATVSRAARS